MQKLIKDGEIVEDRWTVLKEATGPEVLRAVPGKNFIVPLNFWKNYSSELSDYMGDIALWLNSDENVNDIGDSLHKISLIALKRDLFSPFTRPCQEISSKISLAPWTNQEFANAVW